MKRTVLLMLSAIGLGSASILVAQSTLAGPAQLGTVNTKTYPEANARRAPECPMPVSPPAKVNDSMQVTRNPASHSEQMPVAAPLCVNPLGPKR